MEVATQIFASIFNGPVQRGITLTDEKNEWVIGKDYDQELGIELLQIHVRPILETNPEIIRKFK